MKEYCVICKKKLEDFNWKVTASSNGWMCSKHFKSSNPEFVPERIKQKRKDYAKSLMQPWREGKLSKEYIETYGTKRVNATEKDIKSAQNVWKDILPSGWEKTK